MNTLEKSTQNILYRYPGIRPFKKEEDILFFGRNTEINELLHSLKVHDVLVLFSKSGLGKSSLINAGLSPKLLKEKMFPIYIRFIDSNDDPIEKIATEVKKIISKEKLKEIPEAFQNNLWFLFNKWDHPHIPVLIFDQFEEFFYYEANKRNQAISEIAELIGTKVSFSLIKLVEENEELVEKLKKELLDQIADLSNQMSSKPLVKLLFALRSDKLSQIDEMSNKIPGIFNNRYQLKPLRKARAEQAIALPAQIKQKEDKEFRSIPYEYSIESLRIILETLGGQKDEVESTQLQIVCQELESIAINKRGRKTGYLVIEPEDFGKEAGIKSILNKFYEGQLDKLKVDKKLSLQDKDIKVIRHLIEDELLSSKNKRISQHDERVIAILGGVKQGIPLIDGIKKEEAIIKKLLELRLIREEDSHLGKVYEISHDTLVESIVKARDNRNAKEREQLNEQLKSGKDVTVDMLSSAKDSKYCFVVMGFGKKTDFETGRVLDLDKSYRNMIKPVIEASGLKCVRADEIVHSGLIDAPMYEHLLNADIVIADLSTSNKNALYELGVRHALRPFTTIVIADDGVRTFPFDLSHVPVSHYHHLGEDIGFEEIMRFRQLLADSISKLLDQDPRGIDSPVYRFLPYLKPPSLSVAAVNQVLEIDNKLELSKSDRKDWDSETSSVSMLMQQVDEAQKKGDWITAKTLLVLVREMKQQGSTQEDPYLLQRLALITYKSKYPSEKEALEEARGILQSLEPETTNDTETLGLWSTIHKRLWESTKNPQYLDIAVRANERGFYLRNDYYNGINLAFLLNIRANQVADPAEAIADFVLARRVRREVLSICEKWLEQNPVSPNQKDSSDVMKTFITNRYWTLAALGEAYVGLDEEEKAQQVLQDAYLNAPEPWMQASTEEQTSKLRPLLKNSPLKYLKGNS